MSINKDEVKKSKENKDELDEEITIILLGEAYVGKTCLINKLVKNEFIKNNENTIGVNLVKKNMTLKNKKIGVTIWDTAGQEKFSAIPEKMIYSSDGFIIVYDITQKKSFEHISKWMEKIKNIIKHPKIIIFGNKIDLNTCREVEKKEGEALALRYNLKYFETSAKNGTNLNEGLESLLLEILEDAENIGRRRRNSYKLKQNENKEKNKSDKKNKCC